MIFDTVRVIAPTNLAPGDGGISMDPTQTPTVSQDVSSILATLTGVANGAIANAAGGAQPVYGPQGVTLTATATNNSNTLILLLVAYFIWKAL